MQSWFLILKNDECELTFQVNVCDGSAAAAAAAAAAVTAASGLSSLSVENWMEVILIWSRSRESETKAAEFKMIKCA